MPRYLLFIILFVLVQLELLAQKKDLNVKQTQVVTSTDAAVIEREDSGLNEIKSSKEKFIFKKGEKIPLGYLEGGYSILLNKYRLIVYKNKYGLADLKDNVLLPPHFNSITQILGKSLLMEDSTGKFQIYKDPENPILEKFIKVYEESETSKYLVPDFRPFLYVTNINHKMGLMDSTFNWIVTPNYDKVEFMYSNHWFKAKIGDKVGIVSSNNKLILDVIYNNVDFTDDNRKAGNRTFLVRLEDKYGIFNHEGKQLIPIKYDEIKYKIDRQDGLFEVSLNHKYGVIDSTGKTIIPFEYEGINAFEISSNQVNYILKKGNFYGTSDASGKIILPIKYEAINVSKGILVFAENGQKGVADFSGKILIPAKYDLSSFENTNSVIKFKENNKYGLVNFENNIIAPAIYDNIAFDRLVKVKANNKWGMLDFKGNVLVTPKYHKITFLGMGLFSFIENRKLGVIDSTGRVIIQPQYDEISIFRVKPIHFKVKKNDLYGIIDSSNEYILDCQYNSITKHLRNSELRSGYSLEFDSANIRLRANRFNAWYSSHYKPIIARYYGQLTGLANELYYRFEQNGFAYNFSFEGKPIFRSAYEDYTLEDIIGRRNSYNVRIKKDGKWGLIHYSKDSVIIQPKYDNLILPWIDDLISSQIDDKRSLIIAQLNGKFGIIDKKSMVRVPFKYDSIQFTNKNHYIVKFQNKKGFIDSTGRVLIEPIYDEIKYFDRLEGVYLMLTKNKKTAIWLNGKFITDAIFDSVTPSYSEQFSIGFNAGNGAEFVVSQNKKYDVINVKSKLVPQFKYDKILNLFNVVYQVKIGKSMGIYHTKNNTILIPVEYDTIRILVPQIEKSKYSYNQKPNMYYEALKGGLLHLYNHEGKLLLPTKYQSIIPVQQGGFLVKSNNKFGVVTATNQVVVPIKYDEVFNDLYLGHYFYREGKLWGLNRIEKTSAVNLIKPQFDEVSGFKSGYAIVSRGEYKGVIDTNGTEVIPIKYDYVERSLFDEKVFSFSNEIEKNSKKLD